MTELISVNDLQKQLIKSKYTSTNNNETHQSQYESFFEQKRERSKSSIFQNQTIVQETGVEEFSQEDNHTHGDEVIALTITDQDNKPFKHKDGDINIQSNKKLNKTSTAFESLSQRRSLQVPDVNYAMKANELMNRTASLDPKQQFPHLKSLKKIPQKQASRVPSEIIRPLPSQWKPYGVHQFEATGTPMKNYHDQLSKSKIQDESQDFLLQNFRSNIRFKNKKDVSVSPDPQNQHISQTRLLQQKFSLANISNKHNQSVQMLRKNESLNSIQSQATLFYNTNQKNTTKMRSESSVAIVPAPYQSINLHRELERKRIVKSTNILEELEIQLQGDVKVTATTLTTHIKSIANMIRDVVGPESHNHYQEFSQLTFRIASGLNKIAEMTEAEYENSYLKIREANKQLSSELSKAVKQCERQTQEIQRMINLADTGLELESKVKKYLSQESIELEFLKAFQRIENLHYSGAESVLETLKNRIKIYEDIDQSIYFTSLRDRSLLEEERGAYLQLDMNRQISAYDTHLVNEVAKVMCKNLIKIVHKKDQESQTSDPMVQAFKNEIDRMNLFIKSLSQTIRTSENQIILLRNQQSEKTQLIQTKDGTIQRTLAQLDICNRQLNENKLDMERLKEQLAQSEYKVVTATANRATDQMRSDLRHYLILKTQLENDKKRISQRKEQDCQTDDAGMKSEKERSSRSKYSVNDYNDEEQYSSHKQDATSYGKGFQQQILGKTTKSEGRVKNSIQTDRGFEIGQKVPEKNKTTTETPQAAVKTNQYKTVITTTTTTTNTIVQRVKEERKSVEKITDKLQDKNKPTPNLKEIKSIKVADSSQESDGEDQDKMSSTRILNSQRNLNDDQPRKKVEFQKNSGNRRESIAYQAIGNLEDRIDETLHDRPKEKNEILNRLATIKMQYADEQYEIQRDWEIRLNVKDAKIKLLETKLAAESASVLKMKIELNLIKAMNLKVRHQLQAFMLPHIENNPAANLIDFTRDDFDIDTLINNEAYQALIRNAASRGVSEFFQNRANSNELMTHEDGKELNLSELPRSQVTENITGRSVILDGIRVHSKSSAEKPKTKQQQLSEQPEPIQYSNQLSHYQNLLEKAYADEITVKEWMAALAKAKRDLNTTDYRLLQVMIQMRGRFSSTGASLFHKSCQTKAATTVTQKVVKTPKQHSSMQTILNWPFVAMKSFATQVDELALERNKMVQEAHNKNIQRMYGQLQQFVAVKLPDEAAQTRNVPQTKTQESQKGQTKYIEVSSVGGQPPFINSSGSAKELDRVNTELQMQFQI